MFHVSCGEDDSQENLRKKTRMTVQVTSRTHKVVTLDLGPCFS